MDLSVFAQESFDVKQWINSIFKQPDATVNPENYASSLVMKLQLCVHEINSSLESTSSAVVQSLPRLLRDVELLQLEVTQFQEKMEKIQTDVTEVERSTAASMEELMKLELLKTRMQATLKALQEADNWTTLMADIEDLFESGDLLPLSQRLSALKQSLTLLTHVSDYQDRLQQLEGLRNRLEALASPRVFTALSSTDTGSTKILVQVFSSMDRLPQLLNYYSKCRRGVLLQLWRNLALNSQESSTLDLLPTFYEEIQNDFYDQHKWTLQVFSNQDTAKTLIAIYTDVFNSMDPKATSSTEALQRKGLAALLSIKGSMDRFVATMETGIKESVEPDWLLSFSQAVYQPFRQLLSTKYSSILLQQLLPALPNIKSESKEQLANSVQQLRQSISRIAAEVNANISSCCELTHGAGLHLLIKSISELLTRHLRQYEALLKLSRNLVPGEEFTLLHSFLLLLQTLGELLIQVEDISAHLSVTVQSVSRKLNDSKHAQLYLDQANHQLLQQLFTSQTKSNSTKILDSVLNLALDVNNQVQQSVYDVMFTPVQSQLAVLGKPDWVSVITGSGLTGELPDFGLAPLEYITQIGQYLMMLPQHLEPFMLHENSGLSRALAEHVFPFCEGNERLPTETSSATADYLLSCLGKGTCSALTEAILRIPTVNAKAAKQLAADIDYLGNILEDLGFTLSANASHLRDLLRAAAAAVSSSNMTQYRSVCDGKPARLVAAVRNMCNLPSSD